MRTIIALVLLAVMANSADAARCRRTPDREGVPQSHRSGVLCVETERIEGKRWPTTQWGPPILPVWTPK
jgi:hypothetical protein